MILLKIMPGFVTVYPEWTSHKNIIFVMNKIFHCADEAFEWYAHQTFLHVKSFLHYAYL